MPAIAYQPPEANASFVLILKNRDKPEDDNLSAEVEIWEIETAAILSCLQRVRQRKPKEMKKYVLTAIQASLDVQFWF